MVASETRPTFTLGKRTTDFLAVTPVHREHPELTEYWDANWIVCRVEVRVGGFRGVVDASLWTTDFVGLREGLAGIYEDLSGSAAFETLEEWLSVAIRGDGRGHFLALCRLVDGLWDANALKFKLTFDQTEIPVMIRALDRVIETWPVRGVDSPEA